MKKLLNTIVAIFVLVLIILTPSMITQGAGVFNRGMVLLLFLLVEIFALYFVAGGLRDVSAKEAASFVRLPEAAKKSEAKKSMPIHDVKIKQVKRFADDRGFFSEIIKFGEETFCEVKQTSYTETYPGVVKAFHWHKKQFDVWFPIKGNMQVVLYDMREDSPTKGVTQVVYAGENNPTLILIPPGVAHGYRVLGQVPATLVYHTSEAYDPAQPDEERLEWNDPKIGFDWTTKNK